MPKNKLISSISNLKDIEQMAVENSPIHNLASAIKILMTLCYILCILSLGRYEFSQVLLFAFYPILVFTITNLNAKLLLKRSFFSLVFVFFIALANIFIETNYFLAFTGFFCLMLKAFLCILSVAILTATTKINDIAQALRKFHIPCVIVLQLVLSFRYLEVLIKEAINIRNAYILRSGKESIAIKDWAKLAGSLILKSIESSNALYKSMLCRGFNAHTIIKDNSTISIKEYAILAIFCLFCICLRLFNLQNILENLFAL